MDLAEFLRVAVTGIVPAEGLKSIDVLEYMSLNLKIENIIYFINIKDPRIFYVYKIYNIFNF